MMRTTLLAVLPLALPATAPAQPETLNLSSPLTSVSEIRASRDIALAPAPISRGEGDPFDSVIGFTDGFESVAPLPTPLEGQLSTITDFFGVPEWGANELFGQVAPYSGVATAPNGTQALRIYAEATLPPAGFFFGAAVDWTGYRTQPAETEQVRMSVDVYQNTIEQKNTFESQTGLEVISSRLLWGGTNEDDESGLPVGSVIDTFYALVQSGFGYVFARAEFRESAPPGYVVGDTPPIPVEAWYTLHWTLDAQGASRHFIDYLDGSGPHLIQEWPMLTYPYLSGAFFNSSFEGPVGSAAYFDNLAVSGPPLPWFDAPELACNYTDDLEWIDVPSQGPGNLLSMVRQDRWPPLPGATPGHLFPGVSVVPWIDGNALRFEYSAFGAATRPVLGTPLPAATTGPSTTWRACVDLQASNMALILTPKSSSSTAADNAVARVYLGLSLDPANSSAELLPRVFVQTNPAFSPIYTDAFPIVPDVGVDVVDTGAGWSFGAPHTVCIEVAGDGSMTVDLDGLRIHEGAAFDTSIDEVWIDGMFVWTTQPREIYLDNVRLACATCEGDVNDDGLVNFSDLNAVLSSFGQTGAPLPGDDNADGAVDFTDLNAVLSRFGGCD